MPQVISYTYNTDQEPVLVKGFLAHLLLMGEDWDIAQLESDTYDYHQSYYARVDAKIALERELSYWWDFYQDKRLQAVSNRGDMLAEGLYYLLWQARKLLLPMEEADKLTTNMAIYLDDKHYLYKVNDILAVFTKEDGPNFNAMLNGFAAQLLSYAACTSMEHMLNHPNDYAPMQMLRMIADWLHSDPTIWLENMRIDIPDVYRLYESYVTEEKAKWDAENLRRYQSNKPEVRYFMKRLLERVQQDTADAKEVLAPYLTAKQMTSYMRYMAECQQYIKDRTASRKKARSESLKQYWCPDISNYKIQAAIRGLKRAVAQEHPAAALAQEVFLLQQKGIMISNIRPLAQFIRVINKVCGSAVKEDSFSKYFRNS